MGIMKPSFGFRAFIWDNGNVFFFPFEEGKQFSTVSHPEQISATLFR